MRISDWSSDVCSSDLYSDAIWYLTQMRRWGQIADDKPDQWYFDTAQAVYRPDLYLAAASKPVDAGVIPSASVHATNSEGRPVGTECVSTCRSRWSPYH